MLNSFNCTESIFFMCAMHFCVCWVKDTLHFDLSGWVRAQAPWRVGWRSVVEAFLVLRQYLDTKNAPTTGLEPTLQGGL